MGPLVSSGTLLGRHFYILFHTMTRIARNHGLINMRWKLELFTLIFTIFSLKDSSCQPLQ